MRVRTGSKKKAHGRTRDYAANQKHADELARKPEAEEKKLTDLNAEKEELLRATADAREALRSAETNIMISGRAFRKTASARDVPNSKKNAPFTRRRSKSFLPSRRTSACISRVFWPTD